MLREVAASTRRLDSATSLRYAQNDRRGFVAFLQGRLPVSMFKRSRVQLSMGYIHSLAEIPVGFFLSSGLDGRRQLYSGRERIWR